MLVDCDVHHLAGKNEFSCDGDIFLGRLRIAGWMIMREDKRRSVVVECRPDNFPRVYGAGSQGPLKKCFGGENFILGIQKNSSEAFPALIPHAGCKIFD
jgi:hypothetical protein